MLVFKVYALLGSVRFVYLAKIKAILRAKLAFEQTVPIIIFLLSHAVQIKTQNIISLLPAFCIRFSCFKNNLLSAC